MVYGGAAPMTPIEKLSDLLFSAAWARDVIDGGAWRGTALPFWRNGPCRKARWAASP